MVVGEELVEFVGADADADDAAAEHSPECIGACGEGVGEEGDEDCGEGEEDEDEL